MAAEFMFRGDQRDNSEGLQPPVNRDVGSVMFGSALQPVVLRILSKQIYECSIYAALFIFCCGQHISNRWPLAYQKTKKLEVAKDTTVPDILCLHCKVLQ